MNNIENYFAQIEALSTVKETIIYTHEVMSTLQRELKVELVSFEDNGRLTVPVRWTQNNRFKILLYDDLIYIKDQLEKNYYGRSGYYDVVGGYHPSNLLEKYYIEIKNKLQEKIKECNDYPLYMVTQPPYTQLKKI